MRLIAPLQYIVSIPSGSSTLPIVELDKTKVRQPRSRVRLRRDSLRRHFVDSSLGNFSDHLSFSSWEFFHAAKKTELACTFTRRLADTRAVAFAVEHEQTFVWNTGNFRRTDSGVFALEDFAASGLAGRVGEAIAYLTMISWGYVYWDRCAVVWERAARRASISHSEQLRIAKFIRSKVASGRPNNEPDFVFENATRDVALMEAKGSFVHPAKDGPGVKTDLRQALKQLDAWSRVLAPPPHASFGIGTYLREHSDPSDDPSLIAFVDPPADAEEFSEPVSMPPDLVRRCNYGAWLIGMGLLSSGLALRNQQEKPTEEIVLPVSRIGDRDFAFVMHGWLPPVWSSRLIGVSPPHYGAMPWGGEPLVLGIAVDVLRRLGTAIQRPREPVLMDLQAETGESGLGAAADRSWSIMPDGSLLGVIPVGKLQTEIFKL